MRASAPPSESGYAKSRLRICEVDRTRNGDLACGQYGSGAVAKQEKRVAHRQVDGTPRRPAEERVDLVAQVGMGVSRCRADRGQVSGAPGPVRLGKACVAVLQSRRRGRRRLDCRAKARLRFVRPREEVHGAVPGMNVGKQRVERSVSRTAPVATRVGGAEPQLRAEDRALERV